MRNAIRNALLCAGFIAGFFALLIPASQVFMPKGNDRKDGMPYHRPAGIDAEPAQTIDALFIGDSECYYSFIPLMLWDRYGYSTYVCGTPSQKLFETMRWLRRACRNQSPKALLLETDAIFTEITYSEAVTDPLERVFPVLEHHNRWKNLRWKDLYARPVYKKRERDKGYLYTAELMGVEGVPDAGEEAGDSEHIRLLNRKYLDGIFDFCRARGIRVTLVSTPSLKYWDSARHNSIERFAAEMGVDYLDMNRMELNIDWTTDTFDEGDHMNFSGACKVTDCIGRYLADLNLLPDHRGDPAYKRWNKDVKQARKRGMKWARGEGEMRN